MPSAPAFPGRPPLGADDLLQVGHRRAACRARGARGSPAATAESLDTARSPSFRSPKVMAWVGHVCWQAVWMSPSRTGRPASRAVVLALDDPLHAHGALLHDPELAHGDVGVELQVERRRPRVVEPVELPHVVGAVVAAVARAHAAVVDLRVQPLVRVVRGVDRAHRLARRDLAVLAEHGQEDVLGMLGRALLPALQPQPVLDAAVRDLRLARPPARCSRPGRRPRRPGSRCSGRRPPSCPSGAPGT